MKHFWALPAFLRLALASQYSFSVHDDLLAFPQYEITFPDSYVSESYASSRLAAQAQPSASPSPSPSPSPDNPPASDLSHTLSHYGAPSSDSDRDIDSDASSPNSAPNPQATPSPTYDLLILHSQRYLCLIPPRPTSTPSNTTASSAANNTASSSPEAEAKELARATRRGWELLKGMQGSCIYFASGWWSYSYCYDENGKGEVRQFHALPPVRGQPVWPPVEDGSVAGFVLGRGGGDKDRMGKERKGLDGRMERGGEGDAIGEGDGERMKRGGEGEVARLETKGETRYLVQKLAGGTTCDLTGKERRVEVQFHCHPTSPDRIGLIKEVSTCAYLMVIHTPRLCNDIAFLPPQATKPLPISCQPILSEEAVPLWLEAQERRRDQRIEARLEQLLDREGWVGAYDDEEEGGEGAGGEGEGEGEGDGNGDAGKPRSPDKTKNKNKNKPNNLPMAGGVRIGAKALVGGTPDRTIHGSAIVGGGAPGGKERHVATVATSDGRVRLGAEELRKLRIEDPEDVERLMEELEGMAGGKGWVLDVVDTPRGREFRGVIDGDGEKEEEGKERGEGGEDGEEGDEGEQGSEEVYAEEL